MLSLGMFAARHLSSTMRKRGFIAGSPPPSLHAMVISLASLAKIFARLASIAPLKCLTFAHLLCPAIRLLLITLLGGLLVEGCTADRSPRRPLKGSARPKPPCRSTELP